jgi:hypothetical protein
LPCCSSTRPGQTPCGTPPASSKAIEEHAFTHGGVKGSVGVATLPEDVTASVDLIPAADRAL